VTGRLRIEVGGTVAGTQFDQLVVTGNAGLGGTLELALANGFAPVIGGTFQVFTFAARNNNTTFGTVTGSTLANSLVFQASIGAANVTLLTLRNDLAQTYQWVGHLYQDVLGRTASDPEILSWVNLAALGVSRDRIAHGFLISLEYRIRVVQNLYQTILGRAADPGGLNNWATFLLTGTPAQLRASLAASPEYFIRKAASNNINFVRALYHDALGRDASGSELTYWANQFLAGRTRQDAATTLFTSFSHRQVLVRGWYTRFMHRDADPSGLQSNVMRLQNGGRDEDVILNLISSVEYFNRM
jgi:hypothetical protein